MTDPIKTSPPVELPRAGQVVRASAAGSATASASTANQFSPVVFRQQHPQLRPPRTISTGSYEDSESDDNFQPVASIHDTSAMATVSLPAAVTGTGDDSGHGNPLNTESGNGAFK
ncbi:uncharacterized protein LOC129752212 [Uranotaenia lowii]|uniref:uncharacterized protein LOC129752212 n=1 Tax=Uranotaenia lowii TaxID=190385 RepID=UPI00247A3E8A|nr:uncharacterized protein LOC129752212 [Uranotaenia lowii]